MTREKHDSGCFEVKYEYGNSGYEANKRAFKKV